MIRCAKWISRLLPIVLLGLFFLIPACKSDDDQTEDDPTGFIELILSEASDVTFSTAYFTVQLNNPENLPITARGLVWSNTPDPTLAEGTSLEIAENSEFAVELEGLDDGNRYHVRAFVQSEGQVIYSNNTAFSTLEHRLFIGDVILNNQVEIDDFGAMGYTKIIGNLTIDNRPFQESPVVENIDALQGLYEVDGNIEVIRNLSLVNLDGFQQLIMVTGNLDIGGDFDPYLDLVNDNLENLDGLSNLKSVGGNFTLNFGDCCTVVDISGLARLTTVGDGLRIYDMGVEGITSLDPLNSLSSIGGTLGLQMNHLENVDGLSNVASIGETLGLLDMYNLQNLQGLSQLQEIPRFLAIRRLDQFTSLSELSGMNIGSIIIRDCPNLTNLNAFENITSLGHLILQQLHQLPDLRAFSNLESVETQLEIIDNDLLPDLSGLENLGHDSSTEYLVIGFNDGLTSLQGLNNVTDVFEIRVTDNTKLTDFCALNTLITSDPFIDRYFVVGNAYNPTIQDIMDGNCSL